jgi:hypothetical protein
MAHCVAWARLNADRLLPEEQELYSRDPDGFWTEYDEYYGAVDFSVPYVVSAWTGRIKSTPYMWANAFREAIENLEIARIGQCPFSDCGKYFYAVRFNTGACKEHLARARVQRGRDPELRRRYEETRRINRFVREGKSLAAAKATVRNRTRKRRTTL